MFEGSTPYSPATNDTNEPDFLKITLNNSNVQKSPQVILNFIKW